MINHGLSTGALFLLIGMVYERYHTRSMKELGGLAAKMPVWATFMVFFTMASRRPARPQRLCQRVHVPDGRVPGERRSGARAWGHGRGLRLPARRPATGRVVAAIAGTGMIVAAMYLLYMVGKVVWGPLVEPAGHSSHGADVHGHGSHGHTQGHDSHEHGGLPRDLTGREIGVLVPLAALCIFLGVYPSPVIKALKDPVALTTDEVVNFGKARTAMPLVPPANVAPAGHQDNAGHASDAGQNDVSQHKETAR
jgi:NADH-quinone oxidoreductase subunit M